MRLQPLFHTFNKAAHETVGKKKKRSPSPYNNRGINVPTPVHPRIVLTALPTHAILEPITTTGNADPARMERGQLAVLR